MNHKTKSKKVIIIGCGIAGPSLAIALKHVGIESEIYEAASTISSFGVLSFTSNGIRILEMLNVYDKLDVHDTIGAFFYKHNAKLFFTLDVRDELKKYGNEGGFLIKRTNLIQTLSEKAKSDGVSIQLGKKLASIKEKDDKVIAVFEDGMEAEGDLIVGCDGPFSKTRKIILPNSPLPTYTGTVFVGANAGKSVKYDHLRSNAYHMTLGKNAYFGSAIFSDNKMIWWTNVPYPEDLLRDEFKTISQKEWTKKLLNLHKDDHELISNLIKSTNDNYVKIPLYDIPHLPVWHTNSVCLIGDAAHATSPYIGQGAAMAMEDAVVLAMCLRDISNTSKAFSTFEKLRKARVERVVKSSQQNGSLMKSTNYFKQLFRNMILPISLNKSIVKKMDWLFSYKVAWDEKIK